MMDLHNAALVNDADAVRAILEQQTSGGKFMRMLTLRGSLVNERDQVNYHVALRCTVLRFYLLCKCFFRFERPLTENDFTSLWML